MPKPKGRRSAHPNKRHQPRSRTDAQNSSSSVRTRHIRYAKALLAKGVTFRRHQEIDDPTIEHLVRLHIDNVKNWSLDSNSAVVLALDPDQTIIGLVVVGSARHERGIGVLVQHLVVVPEWRRHGIGLVLLGMIGQLLPTTEATFTYGQCTPDASGYYQRAGFVVLPPGTPLVMPLNNQPIAVGNTNTTYSCWFYR